MQVLQQGWKAPGMDEEGHVGERPAVHEVAPVSEDVEDGDQRPVKTE